MKYILTLLLFYISLSSFGQTTGFGQSGTCTLNVNYGLTILGSNARLPVINSTFEIVMQETSGNAVSCTGTLINRHTSDGDLGYYFLMARHCMTGSYKENGHSPSAVYSLNIDFTKPAVFFFNYQSPDGTNADTKISNQNISSWSQATSLTDNSGVEYVHKSLIKLIDDDSWGDFALMEILTPVPPHFNVTYTGWNPLPYKGLPYQSSYDYFAGIHHPEGDIKKISATNYFAVAFNQTPIATGCYTVTKIIDVLFGWIWKHRFSTTTICKYVDNPFLTVMGWDYGVTEEGSSGSGIFDINNNEIGTLSFGTVDCGHPFFDNYGKFSGHYADNPVRNVLNPDNSGTIDLVGMPSRKITCYNNLDLPGAPGVSGYYFPANHYQGNNDITLQAVNNITENAPIEVMAGASYSFRAGNQIDINSASGAALTVDPGVAHFSMDIGGCVFEQNRPEEGTEDREDATHTVLNRLSELGTLPVQKGDVETEQSVTGTSLAANISPNPSSGNFQIQLNHSDNYVVTVRNSLGETVYQQQYSNQNLINISLRKPVAGLYYVDISNPKESIATKIIIK